jgi:hypothetical protein
VPRKAPARRCRKGHTLQPYGTRGKWRCPTCRKAREASYAPAPPVPTAIASRRKADYRRRLRERQRAEAAAATRKKILRAQLITELERRGRVYVPRTNAQNLEDAMRPVRFPGEHVTGKGGPSDSVRLSRAERADQPYHSIPDEGV